MIYGPSSIEPLESRIAPAGVFLATDIDGDAVTIKTSRGTNAQLAAAIHTTASGLGVTIDMIDLSAIDSNNHSIFAGGSLTITAKRTAAGGDGYVNVGTISAGWGTVLGAISVSGDVQAITEGMDAKTLGSIQVRSLSTGTSTLTGNVPSLTITDDVNGAALNVEGTVTNLHIGGSLLAGSVSATSAKSVTIGGSLVGGSADGSGQLTLGSAGAVKILGSIIGGSGSNSGQVTISGKSGAVTIGGDLVGGSAQGAGTLQTGVANDDPTASIVIKGSVVGNAPATNIIDVEGALGSLTIGRDYSSRTNFSEINIKGNCGPISIGGSFISTGMGQGELFVDTYAKSVTIGGDLSAASGGSVAVSSESGSFGAITIKGSIIGGSGEASMYGANIGAITVDGSIQGNGSTVTLIAANAIASLSVKGSVSNFLMVTNTAGSHIGAVKIGGSWTASTIAAGVETGADENYDTADDRAIAPPMGTMPPPSKIASIAIGGVVSGTVGGSDSFGFEAQQIGSFKVGSTVFALKPGAGNDDLSASEAQYEVGSTGDVFIQEVVPAS